MLVLLAIFKLSKSIFLAILLQLLIIILRGDIHSNPGPPQQQLSLCHANLRSIKAPDRFLHLKFDLAGKFHIITGSETWLGSRDQSETYNIPGYQPLRDGN